jgi:hypothetical protein
MIHVTLLVQRFMRYIFGKNMDMNSHATLLCGERDETEHILWIPKQNPHNEITLLVSQSTSSVRDAAEITRSD